VPTGMPVGTRRPGFEVRWVTLSGNCAKSGADLNGLPTSFDILPVVRSVIHATDAVESLTCSLRKVLKNRHAFPNSESIPRALYLARILLTSHIRHLSHRLLVPG